MSFGPARRLDRVLCRVIRAKAARIATPGGIVSFSFDDFPKSALAVGGGILEQYRVRGTYYVAFGLAGGDGSSGRMFDPEDLQAAMQRGHELGCHSYSHLDCGRAGGRAALADVGRNSVAFARMVEGFAPRHFAFPFGSVSLAAKRALAPHFASCRGTRPGLNRGLADLGELRANSIYDGRFDLDAARRLIDEARREAGWVIFYTHDVASDPSPFGCTPGQLEAVVAYACAQATVLPVGDALRAAR